MSVAIEKRDGMCSCGHKESQHDFSYYKGKPVSKGQGVCKVEGCDCKKFTWVGWAKHDEG